MNKHNPRFPFDSVAELTKKQPSISCSPFMVNEFLDFFSNKVEVIRNKIISSPPVFPGDPNSYSFLYSDSQIIEIFCEYYSLRGYLS